MVAAVAPDEPAFERVFAREYQRVVTVAFRILADQADAEDVAQDTFAQLARSGRAAGPGAAAWLAVAAAHNALNAIRSRKRRIARELSAFRLHHPLRETGERLADPLAVLDRSETQLIVRAAMLRLPARDAEILALRYGGSTYRELAAALAIDLAQVGTRLARAERAFKKEIERAALR